MNKYEAIYKEKGFTYCPISEADLNMDNNGVFKPFKRLKTEDKYSISYQNKITDYILPTIK